jgi:ADP-ribose pyrophosphatase
MGCSSSSFGVTTHTVALTAHPDYPARAAVTNVSWAVSDPNYSPVEFTHQKVLDEYAKKGDKGWADPPEWSPAVEAKVLKRMTNAVTVGGQVKLVDGRPQNPMGRTGIVGRGLLGKYGPNQACDALLTRFNDSGVLEMIAVKRGDTGDWALPGGMVDHESTRVAAGRELLEEAIDKTKTPAHVKAYIQKCFEHTGAPTYVGYVDDPRNTDNAWMEVGYHCVCLKLLLGTDFID